MNIYFGQGKLYMASRLRKTKKKGRTFGSCRKLKLWRKRNVVASVGWRSIGTVHNLNITIGGSNDGRAQGADTERKTGATITCRWGGASINAAGGPSNEDSGS